MKTTSIGKIDGLFIYFINFVCFIAGLSIGFWFGSYVLCLMVGVKLDIHTTLPNVKTWEFMSVVFPFALIGGYCLGIPLFAIVVKPFYTRPAIAKFFERIHGPGNYPKILVDVNNAVVWFMFNLIYPEKKE
jgi:hypothetical protein